MVWSLFAFPTVQGWLGARLCAITGLLATVVLSLGMGSTSFLAASGSDHAVVLGVLVAILVLKAVMQQMCFPTSMVGRRASLSACNCTHILGAAASSWHAHHCSWLSSVRLHACIVPLRSAAQRGHEPEHAQKFSPGLLQAIVNRFAPPSKRGVVNGTAQSMASFVRALGPFMGGYMWAVFSGLTLPGHQLLPFAVISATAAGTILIYQFLPRI
jgi:hypothetical protein